MAKDFSEFSHNELIKYIEELQSQLKSEKYGLYWDKNIKSEKELLFVANNIPFLQRKTSLLTSSLNNLLVESDNFPFLQSPHTIK